MCSQLISNSTCAACSTNSIQKKQKLIDCNDYLYDTNTHIFDVDTLVFGLGLPFMKPDNFVMGNIIDQVRHIGVLDCLLCDAANTTITLWLLRDSFLQIQIDALVGFVNARIEELQLHESWCIQIQSYYNIIKADKVTNILRKRADPSITKCIEYINSEPGKDVLSRRHGDTKTKVPCVFSTTWHGPWPTNNNTNKNWMVWLREVKHNGRQYYYGLRYCGICGLDHPCGFGNSLHLFRRPLYSNEKAATIMSYRYYVGCDRSDKIRKELGKSLLSFMIDDGIALSTFASYAPSIPPRIANNKFQYQARAAAMVVDCIYGFARQLVAPSEALIKHYQTLYPPPRTTDGIALVPLCMDETWEHTIFAELVCIENVADRYATWRLRMPTTIEVHPWVSEILPQESVDFTWTHSRYLSEDNTIRQCLINRMAEPINDKCAFVLISHTKTGKTMLSSKVFETRKCTLGSQTAALIFVPRISLAWDSCEVMDARLNEKYSVRQAAGTLGEWKQPANVFNYKKFRDRQTGMPEKLRCVVESDVSYMSLVTNGNLDFSHTQLGKAPGHTKDLITNCDEVEALSDFFSDMSITRDNLETCCRNTVDTIDASNTAMFMEAHPTIQTVVFTSLVAQKKRMHFIINSYRPPPSYVYHHTNVQSLAAEFIATLFAERAGTHKKIYLASQTREYACDVAILAMEFGFKGLCYVADPPVHPEYKDQCPFLRATKLATKNTTETWDAPDIDFVIFSPTIDVGVDCKAPNFSRAFAYISSNSASVVSSIQQIARVRLRPELGRIDVCIAGEFIGNPSLLPQSLSSAMEDTMNAAQLDQTPESPNPLLHVMQCAHQLKMADSHNNTAAAFEREAAKASFISAGLVSDSDLTPCVLRDAITKSFSTITAIQSRHGSYHRSKIANTVLSHVPMNCKCTINNTSSQTEYEATKRCHLVAHCMGKFAAAAAVDEKSVVHAMQLICNGGSSADVTLRNIVLCYCILNRAKLQLPYIETLIGMTNNALADITSNTAALLDTLGEIATTLHLGANVYIPAKGFIIDPQTLNQTDLHNLANKCRMLDSRVRMAKSAIGDDDLLTVTQYLYLQTGRRFGRFTDKKTIKNRDDSLLTVTDSTTNQTTMMSPEEMADYMFGVPVPTPPELLKLKNGFLGKSYAPPFSTVHKALQHATNLALGMNHTFSTETQANQCLCLLKLAAMKTSWTDVDIPNEITLFNCHDLLLQDVVAKLDPPPAPIYIPPQTIVVPLCGKGFVTFVGDPPPSNLSITSQQSMALQQIINAPLAASIAITPDAIQNTVTNQTILSTLGKVNLTQTIRNWITSHNNTLPTNAQLLHMATQLKTTLPQLQRTIKNMHITTKK